MLLLHVAGSKTGVTGFAVLDGAVEFDTLTVPDVIGEPEF
jgi:hypothetical protein